MSGRAPLLEALSIGKSYPGVVALDDVSIELRRGEVHGLVGENGAGKSTLVKIITGAIRPDRGSLRVSGRPVAFLRPADARAHGVVGIFQELSTEPYLSVAANVVLGAEPGSGPGAQLLAKGIEVSRTREVLGRLGANAVAPEARAGGLSVAHRQLIEIARAVALDAPVIVMDEPTASLPGRDVENLLRIVRRLRDGGHAILFVSHRLEEVRQIADRVSVLRGGKLVHTDRTEALPPARMIELMLGRTMDELFPAKNPNLGDVVLKVEGYSQEGAYHDVSFEARAGEVLGFAGLIGAGRSELMRGLFAAEPPDRGQVEIDGVRLNARGPADAVRAGIAYLPEDRKENGLVLTRSARENISLASLRRYSSGGFIRRSAERQATEALARRLQIRGRIDSSVATLSGGNQQKVLLARWLMQDVRVLIFDEPTRGIDVGAKHEVYSLMHELAARGACVLLVSSEVHEVMNVAHRILVMSRGRICDELREHEFDERRILTAAFSGYVGDRAGAPQEVAS